MNKLLTVAAASAVALTIGCTDTGTGGEQPIDCASIPGSAYTIGDYGPAGGTVYYLDDTCAHGLEAAPEDQDDGSGAV